MTNENSKYSAERVAILADQVFRHKELYYAGKPQISDADYDAIELELTLLAPEHPVLQMVGSLESKGSSKVAHDVVMLSLAKTYDENELNKWAEQDATVGTLKIDGNSLSLIYQNGKMTLAKTRGNGKVGEDVTEKAQWVSDVVPTLVGLDRVEIRGELFCSATQFSILSAKMVALGLERPTSPRNIVAGMLGRKQHFDLCRYFSFYAFEAIFPEGDSRPFDTEEAKFRWLSKLGFSLPNPQRITSPKEMSKYLESVQEVIAEGEIGVDGAVFAYDSLSLHDELGNTAHHPRYKMSFKWQGETAESEIVDFLWATSRLGIVTPVAVIEPVQLSGAQITNITLHNASHVKDYNLKVGDRIEIVRSGEVIPKFLRVVKERSGEYSWPSTCPSCQTKLEYDDVRLKCPNVDGCSDQLLGGILNWIRCAEIDDLSEKRLLPLVDLEMVKTAADLYRLELDDFYRIPNTKDKMANKLFSNIQSSKFLPLASFLNGLGIQGAGGTTWEKLLEKYPTLESICEAVATDIQAIDGFAEKSAIQIVDGLKDRSKLIADLLDAGVSPLAPVLSNPDSELPLTGKTLVITGALSQPRSAFEKMIKAAGGKTSSSVSKKTYAVVSDDPDSNSSKMKKARDLGVLTWSEEDLAQALNTK